MKKILSAMLAAAMLLCAVVTVSADDSPFSDVKTSRWSYKSIVYAYENGLMDGIGGGKFDPSGTMTRGMVVTVLYRMEDKPNVEFENAFTDVKAGKYYSDAVIWAKNNNIVNGVSEGKFDPGGKITREQLATMLYRYAEFKGLDTRVKGDLSKFPDADKVHSYAKNALTWATDKGLITGVKSGNKDMLDPRGNATREQFATILQRFKNTDLSAPLEWNSPVLLNDYTEPEYPLVTDADVYVAVDGDDSGPGTFDAPVATFARAAERVAEIKADPAWEPRDLTVAFKAGDYGALQYTLTDESGGGDGYRVTYCKYGDGDVIFSGGTVLREEEFEEITAEEATIFKSDAAADIKKIRVDGISASSKIFGEDGVLHTARFPNMFDDGTDNLFSGSGYPSDENHFTMIPIFTRKLASYHTLEGVKLYGYLTTGWHKDLLTVGGVDKNTNEVYIPHPEEAIMGSLRYGVFPWQEYFAAAIVNASEELDAPGEYFLDVERSLLYVYDPHGEYLIPEHGAEIRMNGANNVTFRGLSFVAITGAGIRARNCYGLHIDMCNFRVTSGNEFIVTEGHVPGHDLDFRLTRSYFDTASLYAVRAHPYEEAPHNFENPTTGFVDNNYFGKIGVGSDGGCALAMRDFDDLTISHNYFEDCTRYAVTFDGCVHMKAEYNAFMRCMYNSADGGVFYTGNDRTQFDNVIRYNVFYPTEWFGVYVDDGGVGVEVYNNLFYGVGTTVVMHDGRDTNVHDNVLIKKDGVTGVTVTDEMVGLMNMVVAGEADLVADSSFYRAWVAYFELVEENPDYKAVLLEQRPDLFLLSADPADILKPEFVLSPTNVITGNVVFCPEPDAQIVALNDNIRPYVTLENNRSFGLDENPFFVDPTTGDYRLAEGVTDCPDVKFEKIGRY